MAIGLAALNRQSTAAGATTTNVHRASGRAGAVCGGRQTGGGTGRSRGSISTLSLARRRWYSTQVVRRPTALEAAPARPAMVQFPAATADRTLQVYLLGTVDFDEMVRCQRRLV